MDTRTDHVTRSSGRLLETLEQLLALPAADLKSALSQASDLVAEATGADKVDLFLYDPRRDSLVAVGSNQPLSALQRKLGLDVLPVTNGGRVVHVYQTGRTFRTGRLDLDTEELRGIKEGLRIKSKLGVPLEVGGARRGMMMIASLAADYFSEDDERFAEMVVRWIGAMAHRAELVEQISRNAMEHGRRAAAEEIVTVLAHDLRNYLGPLEMRMFGIHHRAKEDGRGDDIEDVQAAQRALRRLAGLVNEILDVARIDQGMFRLEPRPFDMVALVEEIAAAMATRDQPIEIRVQADKPLTARVDGSRIRQCMENLFANATQKSPRGAPIGVLLVNERHDDGEWIRVEITDQGPGIPVDLLPHVFERFKAGPPHEGLGLGLYLAKRIAQMHGGDLSVTSTPGQGACFTLLVPSQPARSDA